MFDVLNIFLPALATGPQLEVRHRQSLFGVSDEKVALVEGLPLADVIFMDTPYGSIVLCASKQANEAAQNNETWSRFLIALELVLNTHAEWYVICESDCDQYPVENRHLTAPELSQLLDEYRTSRHWPIALCARAN
jgi:hypothetical protein